MGFLGRRRFRDVVRRQLALFEHDHGEMVVAARREMRAAAAARDTAVELEHYARYEDLSEDIQDELETMCDSFAATLEGKAAADYVAEFERQARAAYRDVVPRLNFPFEI